ncbi:MAG: C4-dicarboxylate ABC transporter permease, partial [Alphaproteobacteria bacterium]|nr:C4-dicarboxylate ABC transporter permease [Alphaproteobacteria bacterium]
MADQGSGTAGAGVDSAALKKAEEFIEQEKGAANRYDGWLATAVAALAVAMTLFHLYAAYDIVSAQVLRPVHVGFVLVLTFLLFPVARRFRNRLMAWDLAAAVAAIAVIWYLIAGGDNLTDRYTAPRQTDVIMGLLFIALLLEATRRTTGWIMPVVAILFLAYALFGPNLPPPWTHRGYDIGRLVGHLYMTLEGVFGVAVD